MHDFSFKAVNRRGKPVRGRLRAESAEAARLQLEQQGYRVELIKEQRSLFARADRLLARLRPASLGENALVTRQLAVMLDAGINLTRALTVINQLPLGGKLASAWYDISRHVNQGDSLSRALGRHPNLFSMLYLGLVKAGETSGQLVANLQTVADHLEKEVLLRSKLKAALTYPAFVFVTCLLMSVLIVQHILPQFLNGLFKGSGVQLPWSTRLLVEITNFLNDPYAMGGALACLLLGSVMLGNFLRTPAGRYRAQVIMLSLPKLRTVVSKALAARFCRTMATLVASGVPIVVSLDLTNMVLGSYVLSEHVDNLKTVVKDGGKLSDGLRQVPFFPPLLAMFVQMGEDTGRVPELLNRLAQIFEEDLDAALVTFTQLLEPLMIGVMGGFVGFVLISIFIPLYQIMGRF